MADFSELPHGVLLKVFGGLALPNDMDCVRNLCAAASVCPSWREAAAEPCLWRKLVLKMPQNERLTGRRLRNLAARSHNTLILLELVGCPLVNDAALALSLQQQPCLVFVAVSGCALVTRPGLAHALCDSEDFQEIVEQLNDPRQSAVDAQRCCVALLTLLSPEVAAAGAEAQAAGVLDALLRCAALHAIHAGVQAACCWALALYIYAAQDTEAASFPSVFQAVLAALKAYPLDGDVQGAAVFALGIVCIFGGLEGTPGVPALLDAIPLVLAALRAFPTDLRVQHNGCLSLVNMCKLDASVAEAVAAAGAMGLFCKTLNLDNTSDNTRIAAVEAIGAIALSKAASPQATAGIDAVVHALNDYESSELLAAASCKTLGLYLRCRTTRERAIQAGAEAAILELLEDYSDEAVQAAANEALKDPQA